LAHFFFQYFLSPFYAAEVAAAAANMTGTLATSAASVAKIPTFIWFDQIAKVPTLSTYLAAAAAQGANTIVPIVVYDLPDRDCAAAASNGEFSIADNGVANYEVRFCSRHPRYAYVKCIELHQ
jgi:cellulose 1,4-beta-cellobiosidase